MRKYILAALLAAGSMTAGEAMATQVNITATNPVIDLTISDTVEAKPDIAAFTTGVQTLAPTASEAVRQNMSMASAVARLKKLGIADKDIQTTQISLNQQFDYRDGQQVFKGYQASNMVNAKLRDLKSSAHFWMRWPWMARPISTVRASASMTIANTAKWPATRCGQPQWPAQNPWRKRQATPMCACCVLKKPRVKAAVINPCP